MAQGLFKQLVWDEASQSFVTYRTQEINPDPISYFIWDGAQLDFFLPSGVPYTYIHVVDYDLYDLPEFTGLYYNNRCIEPDEYSVNGGINLIAYYGAEPDHQGSAEPGIPDEGYTLYVSYTHTGDNNPYEEQSVQHYGAWVNNSDMEYVFYYDVNKNIQRIDRHILVPGSGVFNLTKFSSNLLEYSEEHPYYGEAEVRYYLSEPAKVYITVVADEEGNVHGTTNPAPNEVHTLDASIGENYIIYAQPDLGYTVDHWEIWEEGVYEWTDVSDSSLSFILGVNDPQYTYHIKVYFKKKTFSDDIFSGVTKIATKEDLNQLIDGGFWQNDFTRCPTKYEITLTQRVIDTKYYKIKVNSDYKNNQAVKCEDCGLTSGTICYISFNNVSAQDGGGCIFNERWEQVQDDIYETYLTISGKVYSNDTVVDTFSTPVHFTGTLSENRIVAIRGVVEEFTMTVRDCVVTKLQLDPSSSWYTDISNGRAYNFPETYVGGKHNVDWHITFEFDQN